LALLREAAILVFEQGVELVPSLKIEDPEPANSSDGLGSLLARLPVRVRLRCSMTQLMRLLVAIEHASPVIEPEAIRLTASDQAERLEVELLLTRVVIPPGAEALESGEQTVTDTSGPPGSSDPRARGAGTPRTRR
jgi:hypothetical protein